MKLNRRKKLEKLINMKKRGMNLNIQIHENVDLKSKIADAIGQQLIILPK
jgi:hypothetical protein